MLPCVKLAVGSGPPELWEKKFQLFEATKLVGVAATGNEYTPLYYSYVLLKLFCNLLGLYAPSSFFSLYILFMFKCTTFHVFSFNIWAHQTAIHASHWFL